MKNDMLQEEFERIELFGKEGLFSNGRLADDDIPGELYRYDLRGSDYDPGQPVTVEKNVVVNHAASVLLAEELDLGKEGWLPLGEEELNFLGEEITVQQFIYEQNQKKNEKGLDDESYNISVEGHSGTWYVVDDTELNGEKFFLLESEEYGIEAACIAVNKKGKLIAEDLWKGFDEGFREAAKEYFAEKGAPIQENVQDDSYVPVYYESYNYAKEHDETELRWLSRRTNAECRDAIDQAIRKGFNGMHLDHDVAKPVLTQYGEERVGVVLANTLQHLDYDGRFSRKNKEWAADVKLPENKISYDYILNSHPAILDGFVDLYREEAAKLAKQLEQEEKYMTPTSGSKEPEAALHGLSRDDLEETVLSYAQSKVDEMGLQDDVWLLGVRVYGSRTREGLYTESSDVDVVLSYTGDLREDSFFNALHEEELVVEGLTVDINPISADRNQTLEEYMQKAEKYLDEKEASMEKPFIDLYYVTENLQENKIHEYKDLDSALQAYFSLPNDKPKILGIQSEESRRQDIQLLECENGIDTVTVDYTMVEVWNHQDMSEAVERIDDVLAQRDIAVAYKIVGGYLAMQTAEEGLDYTFYDTEYHVVDGGVYDEPTKTYQEMAKMLLDDNNLSADNCEIISYEDLMEKVSEADIAVQGEIDGLKEQLMETPRIEFYVTECAECPPCGIFHTCDTLEEALKLYDDLPKGRINGTRGIGFEIENDSSVDGMVDILLDDKIQQDIFDKVDPQGKNHLVQKAKSDLENLFEARAAQREVQMEQPAKPRMKKQGELEL